jgi:hypothetical protein
MLPNTRGTVTSENVEQVCPFDVRQEAQEAFAGDSEKQIECACDEKAEYYYFPRHGRGAVYTGGDSEWTDCDSLLDLQDRWEHYDARWSN